MPALCVCVCVSWLMSPVAHTYFCIWYKSYIRSLLFFSSYVSWPFCRVFLPIQVAKVFMGEGAGLIYSVDAAEKITRDVSREAEDQLDAVNRFRT